MLIELYLWSVLNYVNELTLHDYSMNKTYNTALFVKLIIIF